MSSCEPIRESVVSLFRGRNVASEYSGIWPRTLWLRLALASVRGTQAAAESIQRTPNPPRFARCGE